VTPQRRGRRYRSLYVSAALAGVLACAKQPTEPEPGRVQPYGRSYIVSYTSMWGAGTARAASIRDANLFCEGRGLRMMPDKEQDVRPGLPNVSLVFRCLSPDDPEFRPDAKPAPAVPTP
jgi:hypothetical protein